MRSRGWLPAVYGVVCGCVCLLSMACSIGEGDGEVTGVVRVQECNMNDESWDLGASFFGAEAFQDQLDIRIQRGSDLELYSDGVAILVRNASRVHESMLGEAIDLTSSLEIDGHNPEILMSMYLNKRCKVDILEDGPVGMVAVSGSLSFRSIYAPGVDGSNRQIAGSFSNVLLVDPSRPDERRAVIDGSFRFLFVRGRPAQTFPE